MDVNNNIILGIWGVVAFWIGSLYIFEGDYELNNQLAIVYTLVGIGVAYLLMPLAAPLTRRLGKRRGLIICASLGLLNAIVLTLIAHPGNKVVWVAWGLLFLPIGSIGGLFGSSLMPDICDIDELNSGERREALFAAVKTFFGKVIRSGMVLASGFILVFTGYDKELQNHQSSQTLHNMIWLGFPCLIVGCVVGLILTCFIPLTAEYMAKVRAELERRRHSGQAQEGIAE
jgi:GPH family glycoside/pentoside/hexuronide:cation symporter